MPPLPPRVLFVKEAYRLTPNMMRVTFQGPELADLPVGCDGGHCKILLPEPWQSPQVFVSQLQMGWRPVMRTYTIRAFRPDVLELDIDFVAHAAGPASNWSIQATPGDFCGFAGPGPVKMTRFFADWYLVAADPSALSLAAVTLESMPRDARGVAVLEVPGEADRQEIDAPPEVDVHWLYHPDPSTPSTSTEDFIRSLDWPEGRVQACVAGESSVIVALRQFLFQEKGLTREDAYISGYWKIGMREEQHAAFKRAQMAG